MWSQQKMTLTKRMKMINQLILRLNHCREAVINHCWTNTSTSNKNRPPCFGLDIAQVWGSRNYIVCDSYFVCFVKIFAHLVDIAWVHVGLGRAVCGAAGEDLEGEDGRLGQEAQGWALEQPWPSSWTRVGAQAQSRARLETDKLVWLLERKQSIRPNTS